MRLSIALIMTLFTLAITACSATSQAHSKRGSGASSGPYQVEITDQSGRSLRTFHRNGHTWVLGNRGKRYRIKVHNHSNRRIEAVISVDGRDAIDGKRARSTKRGYVINAHDHLLVDGFRVSMSNVATFRFSSVADSYAARMGSDREVGVIGVAIYQERRRPVQLPRPRSWYKSRRWRPDDADSGREGATAKADPPAESSASAKGDSGALRSKSASRHPPRMSRERPGLGTRFGERRHAPATSVAFRRARSWRPNRVLSLRYNNARGLIAMGFDVHRRRAARREQRRRQSARPFMDVPRSFAAPPPGWRD